MPAAGHRMQPIDRRIPILLLALAPLCACRPEAPAAGPRTENPTLAIALASVPPPFTVARNDDGLELRAPGAGTVRFDLGPIEQHGINLVEAVKARKAAFEALPEGRYFGNRELGTPIGTAFTARGAYESAAGPVEETWIFAIHPTRDRMLILTYSYPPGDSQERVVDLLALLGEVQGLAPAAP